MPRPAPRAGRAQGRRRAGPRRRACASSAAPAPARRPRPGTGLPPRARRRSVSGHQAAPAPPRPGRDGSSFVLVDGVRSSASPGELGPVARAGDAGAPAQGADRDRRPGRRPELVERGVDVRPARPTGCPTGRCRGRRRAGGRGRRDRAAARPACVRPIRARSPGPDRRRARRPDRWRPRASRRRRARARSRRCGPRELASVTTGVPRASAVSSQRPRTTATEHTASAAGIASSGPAHGTAPPSSTIISSGRPSRRRHRDRTNGVSGGCSDARTASARRSSARSSSAVARDVVGGEEAARERAHVVGDRRAVGHEDRGGGARARARRRGPAHPAPSRGTRRAGRVPRSRACGRHHGRSAATSGARAAVSVGPASSAR